MTLLYASDNNYSSILSVSLSSLLEHANHPEEIDVYIIDDGIAQENKIILCQITDEYNASIHFIQKKQNTQINELRLNTDRGSITQYARLFVSQYIPEDQERVLYLDCDTLILDDLEELFSADLDGMVLGGVGDAFSKYHWKALGLDDRDVYINSGLMLIDLKRWKENGIENQFIAEIKRCEGKLLQGDQGLINTVLKGKIKRLPLRYDVMTYLFDFTFDEMKQYRKPWKYYDIEEVKQAKENPAIIHFTSSFASMRPWQSGACKHPYAEEWQKHFRNNQFVPNDCREKWTSRTYRILPKCMTLAFAGFIHSYWKPMTWKRKSGLHEQKTP